jgi:hypothetical protein
VVDEVRHRPAGHHRHTTEHTAQIQQHVVDGRQRTGVRRRRDDRESVPSKSTNTPAEEGSRRRASSASIGSEVRGKGCGYRPPMLRRSLAALLAVASASLLLACRPNTVELQFEPEVGDVYRYEYVIEATITRTVEGDAPKTTELAVTVQSTQKVMEVTEDGALLEVTLRSSSSPNPSKATVQVDRAGSLEAIQQIDGLPADTSGLSTDALLAGAATKTPDRPLAVGDRWDIRRAPSRATGGSTASA